MIIDFKSIKSLIKKTLMHYDHSTVLHKDDMLAVLLADANQKIYVLNAHPTCENLAQLFFNKLQEEFKDRNFVLNYVTLHETPHNTVTVVERSSFFEEGLA